MVCSFFATGTGICVQSLSFTAFSAIGIHVRLFVFALLAFVSVYQCMSQFLVSCCALAAHQLCPWRFELDFFSSPSQLPCRQPYKFHFYLSKPHLVFRHKVYATALREVLATQMGVTEAQLQSARLNCTNLTLFSPHFGSILLELVHSYALGCLRVVTVCCNTVGRHG